MWLVFLKILYDGSGCVKVLVWLFILYIVGCVVFEMYGWVGIIILLFLIIGFILSIIYFEPKTEEKQFSFNYEEEQIQKKQPLVFKKKLTDEAAEQAFQKAIKKHPDAVSDITMQGDDKIYRLYWLDKEESDSYLFDVNFTIKKDCQSMDVTITNESDKPITVDWKQFKIDRRRVLLDGLDWIDFKGNGKIESGMSSTVSVQPSLYRDGIPIAMFDLDKIKEEELVFKVSFHVKSPATSKSLYTYTVHTKLKMIF